MDVKEMDPWRRIFWLLSLQLHINKIQGIHQAKDSGLHEKRMLQESSSNLLNSPTVGFYLMENYLEYAWIQPIPSTDTTAQTHRWEKHERYVWVIWNGFYIPSLPPWQHPRCQARKVVQGSWRTSTGLQAAQHISSWYLGREIFKNYVNLPVASFYNLSHVILIYVLINTIFIQWWYLNICEFRV